MKLIVIGIGQSLRGDDSAGLEMVRLWREKYQETAGRVRVELSELPGLALLDLLKDMDAAIIVDAAHSSASPGKIIHLGPDNLASYTLDARSAHGWGVAETLQLGQAMNISFAECRLTLIGIVGKNYSLGAGLSPEVRDALTEASKMLEEEVRSLL